MGSRPPLTRALPTSGSKGWQEAATHAVVVTFQALHKSLFTQYLILCKLPTTLVVFTSVIKGTFPGQSEGAGSINIIRNIARKLGDFDGVARARRAYFLTQHIQVSVPRHTPCSTTVTVTAVHSI